MCVCVTYVRDERRAPAQRGQQADDGRHLVAELGVGGGGGGAGGGAARLAGGGGARHGAAGGRHAGQQLLRQPVLGQGGGVHAAAREPVGQGGEAAQGAVRHLEGAESHTLSNQHQRVRLCSSFKRLINQLFSQ